MSVSVELYSDMQNNINLTKSQNIVIVSHRAACRHRMYRGNIAELFLIFASNIITTLVDFYSTLQTFITEIQVTTILQLVRVAWAHCGITSWILMHSSIICTYLDHQTGELLFNSVDLYCLCKLLFHGQDRRVWRTKAGLDTLEKFSRKNYHLCKHDD